jgi:hypothetical protein
MVEAEAIATALLLVGLYLGLATSLGRWVKRG